MNPLKVWRGGALLKIVEHTPFFGGVLCFSRAFHITREFENQLESVQGHIDNLNTSVSATVFFLYSALRLFDLTLLVVIVDMQYVAHLFQHLIVEMQPIKRSINKHPVLPQS